MKLNINVIGQVLSTALHLLNITQDIVPPDLKAWVTFGLAVVQAGLGVVAHYSNPDGTDVKVAYKGKE